MIPWQNHRLYAGFVWLFRSWSLSRDKGADQAPLGVSERRSVKLEAAF